MYRIEFAESVAEDLRRVPTFYRQAVLAAIDAHLLGEPRIQTRNRKLLEGLNSTPWSAIPPIWELRVGEYRVFYDVDCERKIVYVRAVKRKEPGRTTGEIL